MTTMEIESLTFSWCAQVATTQSPNASTPTGQGLANVTSALGASSSVGPFVFVSAAVGAVGARSPATASSKLRTTVFGAAPRTSVLAASTLSTVIVRQPGSAQVTTSSEQGPVPTLACGSAADKGNFTFNDVKPMPMLSPYHRFYFSEGFNVLPPPPDPYVPSSGHLMLQFTPESITNVSVPDVPRDAAKISLGPQTSAPCFSFNFYGVSLGCDSKDSHCQFTFSGMRYDHTAAQEIEATSQIVNVSGCSAMANCRLTPVHVTGFHALSSILITSKVDGQEKPWWADDMTLGWSDNTCTQAVCRSQVPDPIMKRAEVMASQKAASKRAGFGLFWG
ncbi:hypothetical protein GGR56DRAFT_666192 [Xylariaceae sp. FL0804]|nr:hypothetical protein GGR56DRAFT_668508 [Xylariaceae sp. FL0804]KAI0474948.1 hypothetical protein GGR56DRAFT_666192 [Xylariaceae sp. FL0804]